MKADIKYKLLQHINQKNKQKEEGFTLIELLVVIIIIGILAAIALPSFLNQANKAKQTEAKQTLSAMNKSQQAYYVENNGFLENIEKFQQFGGTGIKTQTANYTYGVVAGSLGAEKSVVNTAKPAAALLAYAGGVGLVQPVSGGDTTSQTALCQSKNPGANPAANSVDISNTAVKCGAAGSDWPDAK